MFKRIRARKEFLHGKRSPSSSTFQDRLSVVPYGSKLFFGVGKYRSSIYSKELAQ